VKRLWGETPPPVLYHYTKRQGLQGIVQSRSIWASEARYLNDARELTTAIDLVREIIAKRPASDLHAQMEGILNQMREGQDTFVFSMSNDGGDELSQWRAYARPGDGYAIGFDAPTLQKTLQDSRVTSHLAACEYNEKQQRALMAEIVENAEATVAAHGASAVREATRIFASLFLLTAPIVKDGAFRGEKEWRLVLPAFSTWHANVKFYDSGRLLVPYWTVPLAAPGALLPIKEVVIGPTPHTELEARAVSALLTIAGLPDAKVRNSNVPYRGW
jgi:hypothetical protein